MGYKLIKGEPTAYYDVDNTLVMHDIKPEDKTVQIQDPYVDGKAVEVRVHEEHVNLMKQHYERGYTIVVWSAGGALWAEAVVKALGLQDIVSLIITKPSVFIDDLKADGVLPSRVYLPE